MAAPKDPILNQSQNIAVVLAYVAQAISDPDLPNKFRLLLDSISGSRYSDFHANHDLNYGGEQNPRYDQNSIRYNIEQLAANSNVVVHKLTEVVAAVTGVKDALTHMHLGTRSGPPESLPELERAVSEVRRTMLEQAEAREGILKEQLEELTIRARAFDMLIRKKHRMIEDLKELCGDDREGVQMFHIRQALQAILDVAD